MRGVSFCDETHTQHAARCGGEAIVRRLAVDEKLGSRCDSVRSERAVAAPLLSRDKQQTDARLSVCSKTLGGCHLFGENPLGIACAAPVEQVTFLAARKKRRHAVEVRREDHTRLARRGDHVRAAIGQRLLEDGIAARPQKRGEHRCHFGFTPRRGIDIDQLPGKRDQIYRIHVSSSVRVSVRSSRYFTMTGVERERPQSRPAPTVTARPPGTTTAASGMTSGCPGAGLMIVPRGRSYTGVDPVSTVPAAMTARD